MNPDYYKNNGKDLFTRFEEGLLTVEEYRGFLKGNLYKYVTRYKDKNGQEDLIKAETYLETLEQFEAKRWADATGNGENTRQRRHFNPSKDGS